MLGQLLASLGRARSLGRERGERGSLVGPLGPKQGERESLFSFFSFYFKAFSKQFKKNQFENILIFFAQIHTIQ